MFPLRNLAITGHVAHIRAYPRIHAEHRRLVDEQLIKLVHKPNRTQLHSLGNHQLWLQPRRLVLHNVVEDAPFVAHLAQSFASHARDPTGGCYHRCATHVAEDSVTRPIVVDAVALSFTCHRHAAHTKPALLGHFSTAKLKASVWCAGCKKPHASDTWSCPCGHSWTRCTTHFNAVHQCSLQLRPRPTNGNKRTANEAMDDHEALVKQLKLDSSIASLSRAASWIGGSHHIRRLCNTVVDKRVPHLVNLAM